METSDTTKEYELAFVLKSEEAAQAVSRVLAAHEAKVTFQSPVNRITLAYKIKKITAAFFGYVTFTAEPNVVLQIDRDLKTSADVMRVLMITPPIGKQKARTMFSPRRPFLRPSGDIVKSVAQPISNEALEKKLEEIMQ
ncbi:MAG: 30S ribosomal protein S6 [bacterium]|nr:30S ribosomal protein S6 [bacterium]